MYVVVLVSREIYYFAVYENKMYWRDNCEKKLIFYCMPQKLV